MRKFKKALAVVSAAVMTMAMSVTALADTTVTYHFYNAKGWDNVGAWVKQNVDWSEECLPLDKCILKDKEDGSTPTEPIWPGAKMDAEGGGWYKVVCTYTAPEKGSAMIFNNYVGDSTPGDTTSQADIDKLRANGIVLNDVATKEQTNNIMITANKLTANEYWIEWDGNEKASMIVLGRSDLFKTEAPASYIEATSKKEEPTTTTGSTNTNTNTNTDTNTNTNNNAAGTTTDKPANTKPAPTTGDSVAVSVVLLGLASAVAVVASKKKANA